MTVNWNARRYSKNEFIEAWNKAESVADVARTLGCNTNGGGYYTLEIAAKSLNLSKDHMLGRGWARGKTNVTHNSSRPLKDILVENSDYCAGSSLKKRLLKEGLLAEQCSICFLGPIWNKNKLVLQLDHINGNKYDNRIENLRFLCPNCHSQTSTFCSKNRKRYARVVEWHTQPAQNRPVRNDHAGPTPVTGTKIKKGNKCIDCSKSVYYKSTRCKSCSGKFNQETKIDWPTNQELLDMLAASNYSALGRKLGVSDNAIRKRLKIKE